MSPSVPTAARVVTRAGQATLRELRARYRAGRDLFDANQLGRFQFSRCRHRTGRLAP